MKALVVYLTCGCVGAVAGIALGAVLHSARLADFGIWGFIIGDAIAGAAAALAHGRRSKRLQSEERET